MRKQINVLLRVVLMLMTPGTLAACSCPELFPNPNLIRQSYFSSSQVVVGKVVSADNWTNRWKVVKSYKGGSTAGDTLTTHHLNSCTTIYPHGYFIIYSFQEGGRAATSYCSPNERLDPAAYNYITGADTSRFEAFLAAQGEHYNLHLHYLKQMQSAAGSVAKKRTLFSNANWYRRYTNFTNLLITLFLSLTVSTIWWSGFSLNRSDLLRAVSVAVALGWASIAFYSETKYKPLNTEFFTVSFGFPKPLLAVIFPLDHLPSRTLIQWINLGTTLLLYTAVLVLAFTIVRYVSRLQRK